MRFSKGSRELAGGAGDGSSIVAPIYWYAKAEEGAWRINGLNNNNSPDEAHRRVYIRVVLDSSVSYKIGMAANDFDGRAFLYKEDGTNLKDNDESYMTVEDLTLTDSFTFQPSETGVYIIALGSYSEHSGTGSFTACCYPAPIKEDIPRDIYAYETSSGFDELSKPIRSKSADELGCALITHPKKGLVVRYDITSLTAETGQQFVAEGGTPIFMNKNGIDCMFLDGNTTVYTTDQTDLTAIQNSGKAAFSFWVKVTIDAPTESLMVGRSESGYYTYKADFSHNRIDVTIGDFSSINYNINLRDLSWTHVLVTHNQADNNYKLYINGKLVGTTAFNTWRWIERLYVGRGFKGWLAGLRVYDRALTEAEVYELSHEYKEIPSNIPEPAYFSGSYTYANISEYTVTNKFPSGKADRTVSLWAKQSKADDQHCVFCYGESSERNAFIMWLNSQGFIVDYNNYNASSYVSVPVGEWLHICVTLSDNATVERVYINGQLASESAITEDVSTNTASYYGGRVGAYYDGRYFVGNIKECSVYDRALNADEVAQLYDNQAITDGRIFYAPLTKGASTDMFDYVNLAYGEI